MIFWIAVSVGLIVHFVAMAALILMVSNTFDHAEAANKETLNLHIKINELMSRINDLELIACSTRRKY